MFLICSWFLLELQPGPCLPLGFYSERPVIFRMKIRDLCCALSDARDGRDKEGQSGGQCRVLWRLVAIGSMGTLVQLSVRVIGALTRAALGPSLEEQSVKWPLTQRRGPPGRRPTSAEDRDPDARADWKAEASAGRARLQSSDSCGKRRPCRWLGEHGWRAWVETQRQNYRDF